MNVVYRYRVKSLCGLLNRQSRTVNRVWNFCNETQQHALKWSKKWPTGFDLDKLTFGCTKEIGLHSGTVSAICMQYAKSRTQHNRPYLRWRGKKSLGWVPLKGRDIKELPEGFRFGGRNFKVFKSRDLPPGAKIKDNTSFSCDRRGNWFLNVCVEVAEAPARPIETGIGIDLGLKTFASLSNGEVITNPRHLARHAQRLATAQRARKKRQVTNIHARIRSARQDHLHKASLDIIRRFDYIAIGDIAAPRFAKTKMAKSVSDASWTTFRSMLAYKAIRHGATFEEVDERFTTQTCNVCGVIAGPAGRAGLNKRSWICVCGVEHDRDQNAALNILFRGSGHRAPVEGIAGLHDGGNVNRRTQRLQSRIHRSRPPGKG